MNLLSEKLDQVLSRAIPQVEETYGNLSASEWDARRWSQLEDEIGSIYRSYLRSLLHDPHVEDRPEIELAYVVKNAAPFGTNITLGAINQRGLFRRNGRATLLEPCGDFSPRTQSASQHDALHHVYMHLVRKSQSINQLFLGTTGLRALEVRFVSDGIPSVRVTKKRDASIQVPAKLADHLVPQDLRRNWKKAIERILKRKDGRCISDSIRTQGCLPAQVMAALPQRHRPERPDPLNLIRKWPDLFRQWLSVYPEKNGLQSEALNMEKAGILFGSWLWSIAWLMFYCQKGVAGSCFYTVRLPAIIGKPERVLPESSMSLVLTEQLDEDQRKLFNGAGDAFLDSRQFENLQNIAGKCIKSFCSKRLGNVAVLAPADRTHVDLKIVLQSLYSDAEELPVDFRHLYFLLNLARRLVGRRHEGRPLRFCFIHGFGYERVDAESKGALQEFGADLFHRWLRFCDIMRFSSSGTCRYEAVQQIGKTLASWIKSNDLQLQRPDVAVYLEETYHEKEPEGDEVVPVGLDHPLPMGLVQVRYLGRQELHPVGSELELRQALRDLTKGTHRTVGIVTASSGLFVFIKGSCLMVRCSGREDWDEPFYFHITGEAKPLEEQIERDLKRLFKETFGDRKKVAEKAASSIRDLCEALVSMGHGAMFVVRPAPTRSASSTLPPLNPVWLLRSSLSRDGLKQECAIYSLMAALDGATELLLPHRETDGIEFRCRRYAQTLPEDWVWTHDDDETGGARAANEDVDVQFLVGKGTRHHTALAVSRGLQDALVITVSADGPVTIFKKGDVMALPSGIEMRFAP